MTMAIPEPLMFEEAKTFMISYEYIRESSFRLGYKRFSYEFD